jgi:hypothetical protein
VRLKSSYVLLMPTYYRNTAPKEEDMNDLLESYVELAKKQGWTITDSTGQRLHWKNPDGVQQAYTPMRIRAVQDAKNCKSRLKKAGLVFENTTPIQEEEEVMAKPVAKPNSTMETVTRITKLQDAASFAPVRLPTNTRREDTHTLIRSVLDGTNHSDNILTRMVHSILNGAEELAISLGEAQTEKEDRNLEEAMELLDTALKSAEALEAAHKKLSDANAKMGLDLKNCSERLVEQTDRANKAENKLRMFRSALSED